MASLFCSPAARPFWQYIHSPLFKSNTVRTTHRKLCLGKNDPNMTLKFNRVLMKGSIEFNGGLVGRSWEKGRRGSANPRPLGTERSVLDHSALGGLFAQGIIPQGNHPPGESFPWGIILLGDHSPGESFSWGIILLGDHPPGEKSPEAMPAFSMGGGRARPRARFFFGIDSEIAISFFLVRACGLACFN